KILVDFCARNSLPLYLKLAFEEARRWRSFDLDDCRLADGLSGLSNILFDRLAAEGNHGRVLVRHGFAYLAAARFGLTETELLDLLAKDSMIWKDCVGHYHEPPEHRLPISIWSRLRFDLEPYLTEREVPGGTTLSLF